VADDIDKVENALKVEWAKFYLNRLGNVNPTDYSIQTYLNLLNPDHEDYDQPVARMFKTWLRDRDKETYE
jgi:hypothetical protein